MKLKLLCHYWRQLWFYSLLQKLIINEKGLSIYPTFLAGTALWGKPISSAVERKLPFTGECQLINVEYRTECEIKILQTPKEIVD